MTRLRSLGILAGGVFVAGLFGSSLYGCSSSSKGGGETADSGSSGHDSGAGTDSSSGVDSGAATADTGSSTDTGSSSDSTAPETDSAIAEDTSAPPADSGSVEASTIDSATSTDSGSPPVDASEAGITCTPNQNPATHTVMVAPNNTLTFSPSALTICPGDTVEWMWAGSGHDVTSGTVSGGVGTPDNKFCNQNNTDCANAPLENAGNTYSFVFTTAGSYSYYCRPHASFGMTGTITVQ